VVAAGLGPPPSTDLLSLLALNGLRVSEATGADIEHLGLERGHRTLVINRKGGKVVIIPLAHRTARAIDLATGEQTEAPLGAARRRTRRTSHHRDKGRTRSYANQAPRPTDRTQRARRPKPTPAQPERLANQAPEMGWSD
jgi:hypothetical protein